MKNNMKQNNPKPASKKSDPQKKWSTGKVLYYLLRDLQNTKYSNSDKKDNKDKEKGRTASDIRDNLLKIDDVGFISGKEYRPTTIRHLNYLIEFGKLSGLFTVEAKTAKDEKNLKRHTYYSFKSNYSENFSRLNFEAYARLKGISEKERDIYVRFYKSFFGENFCQRLNFKSAFPTDKDTGSISEQTLSSIYQAIDKKVTIRVKYGCFDKDHKLVERLDDNENPILYEVNPLQVISYLGRPYLICKKTENDELLHLRVDHIYSCALVRGSFFRDKTDLSREYDRLYMSEGNTRLIEIETDFAHINDIIDWFGNNVKIRQTDEKIYSATVQATKQAMVYWALQYSDSVTVKGPDDVVDEIRAAIKRAAEKYNIE